MPKQQNLSSAPFPITRMRRRRTSRAMRDILAENRVHLHDLIYPIFVEEGIRERVAIPSLPDVFRETEQSLVSRLKDIEQMGIRSIILFGISHNKDHTGSDCLKSDGLLSRMTKAARQTCPDMLIIVDLCFCEYTDHGHCGPLGAQGTPDNDETCRLLGQQAVVAAKAGADIIAPSGMMDGMVQSIRAALDADGFSDISIMSYAVKYASAHYGPFRDAAGCSLASSSDKAVAHRKNYQMDPANREEAFIEAQMDIAEGADMLIIKPGLPYLDIVRDIKNTCHTPLFAYHVSGEYAMLKAASEKKWIDYADVLMEQMLSFKRAGCTGIITYAALDIASILNIE